MQDYAFKNIEGNHSANDKINELSNYANLAIKFLDKTINKGRQLDKKIMEYLSNVSQRITNILEHSPKEYLKTVEVLKQYEKFLDDLVKKMGQIAFHNPATEDETKIKFLIIGKIKNLFNNTLIDVRNQLTKLNNANPVNFPKAPEQPPKDEKIPEGQEEKDCCCCKSSCCSIL